MELKEYLKIFKNNYKFFLGTIILTLVIGISFYLIIGDKYRAELNLNVTRTNYQADTADYRYDEFYRLQADERFADTLVRWLGSKFIQNEISKEANGVLFEKLKAERLSSQMIRVSFIIDEKNQAAKITQAIDDALNENIAQLNAEQKNPQWFKVLVSYPIVDDYKLDLVKLIGILLFLGIFLGSWVVLIRHYLR